MERDGDVMAGRGQLPLYVRLSERLIREIASGLLPDGSRLPPERQLAQDLGASVGTLRKALADLAEKGMLDRVQGSGNYVRYRSEVASVYAFFRLERPRGGGLPSAEVLSISSGQTAPLEAGFGTAHRIRRLRLLEAEPVALEEIWLDAVRAEKIDEPSISESLYLYYRDALGLIVERVEDRVGSERVPDWSVDAFRPRPGQPGPFVARRSFAGDGRIIEYSRTWFDNDNARYVVRMGRS